MWRPRPELPWAGAGSWRAAATVLVAGANEPSRGFASGDLPLGPDSLPLRPGRGAWTRAVSLLEADVSARGTSGLRGQGPHRAGGTCWRHGDTLGVHGQTAPRPQRTAAAEVWEGRGGAWTDGGGPQTRARSCLFPLSPWEADLLTGSGGVGGGQGFRGWRTAHPRVHCASCCRTRSSGKRCSVRMRRWRCFDGGHSP